MGSTFKKSSPSFTKSKHHLISFIGVLPVLILVAIFSIYPITQVITKSFTNWNGLYKQDFIGLKNYLNIFSSEYFWLAVRNCLIMLINVPIQMIIGIIVSMLLYEKVLGWKFFRALFYLPQIVSAVIVGYIFKIFFSYDGPLNYLLSVLGKVETIDWIGNRGTALFVIIFALIWINIGWQSVLFLGGLTSVSSSVLEAAELDGAGFFRRTFSIVLPMLGRISEYSLIMSISWTFAGLFPFIFAITKGGPGYDTTTLDYLVYQKAFVESSSLGQACALAAILMFVISAITLVQKKVSDRLNDWGE